MNTKKTWTTPTVTTVQVNLAQFGHKSPKQIDFVTRHSAIS